MWTVIEVVLEVVDAHLNETAERARLAGIAEPAPEGDTARAAVARGLPATTDLTELLAHERSTAAMLAVRDVFDEMAPWRREAEESRRVLASAGQLLDALRSRPIEERPPVEREAVTWLVDRLDAALGPRLPLLEAALEAERARVALVAAELAAPAGMARLEWLAQLNVALSEDAASSNGPARSDSAALPVDPTSAD